MNRIHSIIFAPKRWLLEDDMEQMMGMPPQSSSQFTPSTSQSTSTSMLNATAYSVVTLLVVTCCNIISRSTSSSGSHLFYGTNLNWQRSIRASRRREKKK